MPADVCPECGATIGTQPGEVDVGKHAIVHYGAEPEKTLKESKEAFEELAKRGGASKDPALAVKAEPYRRYRQLVD